MQKPLSWLLGIGVGVLTYGVISHFSKKNPSLVSLTDAKTEQPMLVDPKKILIARISPVLQQQEDCYRTLTELWIEGENQPVTVLQPMVDVASCLKGFCVFTMLAPSNQPHVLVNPRHINRIEPSGLRNVTTDEESSRIFFGDGRSLKIFEPLQAALDIWGRS